MPKFGLVQAIDLVSASPANVEVILGTGAGVDSITQLNLSKENSYLLVPSGHVLLLWGTTPDLTAEIMLLRGQNVMGFKSKDSDGLVYAAARRGNIAKAQTIYAITPDVTDFESPWVLHRNGNPWDPSSPMEFLTLLTRLKWAKEEIKVRND